MGDEEHHFVQEAFESNYIAPVGPQVDAFEREFAEYTRIERCVAVSSGTAAMHLALRHLGVGPGDEVFASTLTFVGSISPIIFLGATPVFIDSDRVSWNMDPDLLAEELEACKRQGKLPKAVVPTDLYGQCSDYDRVYSVCEKNDVPVVMDSAEAMGAKYQRSEVRNPRSEGRNQKSEIRNQKSGTGEDVWIHAGKGARAAVFSFNGNKIITTSGGGMLASDDEELIAHARKLSQQARENLPHYEHDEIGYNYRMSNILAAIGRGQLRVLDERVERKREIFDYYKGGFGNLQGIEFMPEPEWSQSSRWLTVILITPDEFGADREVVRLALEAENIEARPVWKPMHMQPVFDVLGRKAEDSRLKAGQNNERYKAKVVGGEVAEDLFNRGLCLPSGTAMTNSDLDRIIETILKCKRTSWGASIKM